MTSGDLGLTESVSIALGGMIGGGIYAVLGVVAGITGRATWAAFVLAGLVALCAGYSYNVLNRVDDANQGGSVSFVQSFVGNTTLAGMVGWTLLVGYVGSMAMYAFAFGEFTVAFQVVPGSIAGIPTRPVVSVLAVAGFVGLNLLGATATGSAENVLVGLKVAILVGFGVLGIVYAIGISPEASIAFGSGQLATVGPVMAAAISFVAFQGWQLLFYDQRNIANPVETIRTAVYVAIPVAVLVYVLVGVVTVNLVPSAVEQQPHTALKVAAERMTEPFGLAAAGGTVLAFSALFSTGSAINATLFSGAHFAEGMVREGLLPDVIPRNDAGDTDSEADGGNTDSSVADDGETGGEAADGNGGEYRDETVTTGSKDGGGVEEDGDSGVSAGMVLLIGGVTASFTALGSLQAITSFASLSFIVVFGAMSYLAVRQRDRDAVNPLPPALGVVGTGLFFPVMLWHLFSNEPGTLVTVAVIAVAVVTAELLYFERDVIEREIDAVESAALGDR